MLNNLEQHDKILKIFSGIRCLNRDQLPRYLDGRLTDVEKHLVEQHLADCDLCFDALQVLQQAEHREKYLPLSQYIQQYIRSSIKRVSHIEKVERYQRKEKKRESMLIYFWAVAFVVLGAGLVYLLQQQSRIRASAPKPLMNAGVTVPSAAPKPTAGRSSAMPLSRPAPGKQTEQAPLIAANNPKPAPPAATPRPDTARAKAAPRPVKKDTVKAAVKPPAVVKPTDSARKPAAPSRTPDTLKKEAEKETENKPAPPPATVAENKPPEKKAEPKPAAQPPEPASTDEFLYRAAMVYHQQGDLNEAISRYKRLSSSNGRIGEMARYQLGVCYRSKGQTGKARRMFREVVKMNGNMKDKAQEALDNL